MQKEEAVSAAIRRLAKLGVLNSPDYWLEHWAETRYVGELLVRAAAKITRTGARTATVTQGVAALVMAGVIDSPMYWLNQTGTVAELLRALGGALEAPAVTEAALRQKVVNTIAGWLGATRGSAGHLDILSTYNGFTPLAQGYLLKASDDYCAATVSAAFIKAGIAAWTGTECGVERFVRAAQQRGIWVENDAWVPSPGDAMVYDWGDSGAGDSTGWADHIGIVERVAGTAITLVEGNIQGGTVARKNMQVNGRFIRGYIVPDYAAIAAEMRRQTT